jgi:hypothetical protein
MEFTWEQPYLSKEWPTKEYDVFIDYRFNPMKVAYAQEVGLTYTTIPTGFLIIRVEARTIEEAKAKGLLKATQDKLQQEEQSAEHYRNWCQKLEKRVAEYEKERKWNDTSHFSWIRSIFRK